MSGLISSQKKRQRSLVYGTCCSLFSDLQIKLQRKCAVRCLHHRCLFKRNPLWQDEHAFPIFRKDDVKSSQSPPRATPIIAEAASLKSDACFFEQHPCAINFWASLTGIVIRAGRKLFGYQSAVTNNLLADFDSGCNRRLTHPNLIECFHRGGQSFHRRHPFFYDPLCIWVWMRNRRCKTGEDYQ